MHTLPRIVYYSSPSAHTHRFVQKLGFRLVKIPINEKDGPIPIIDESYVLVLPTYEVESRGGAVPGQVIRFLNNKTSRSHLLAVAAGGNRNFGSFFGHAAKVVSEKCKVPILHMFELSGTDRDVEILREKVNHLWTA